MLGFEVYALNLAALQKASGHDVMMLTNRAGALWEACHRHDIPVVAEPSMDQPRAREASPELVSKLGSFGASVVNCHTPRAASRAIPAGNQLGIPCVNTIHIASTYDDADAGDIAKLAEDMKFAAICISKTMFEALKKHGLPEAELHYVPVGTMPPSARAVGAGNSGRPNLIYVGTLESDKGTDLAILAMAELHRRRGPDCPILSIYGSGETDEYYKEMASVLQLNDIVRFCGFQANILDRCSDSDVLLMSSRFETGPLVVLEAMSRGMPIVATEVGTVSEMLPDRRYGRIAAPNSIIPLADAVESLLDDVAAGLFDPSLVIERHRSLFTIQKMAERVEVVYAQAIAANAA